MTETLHSHYLTATDGTRLHVAVHHSHGGEVPLLCLPGLTRNGKDFAPVVSEFGATRTIIMPDFRGRGLSSAAADPLTYRPDVELHDVILTLDDLGIDRVAVLGTSRGGIVGMLMAAQHGARLAGLLLNDIGPRIEPEGLLRIMDYVGRGTHFATWDEAARAFASTQSGFANVSPARWLDVARQVFVESPRGITAQHDTGLRATLPAARDVIDGKLPELWALLPALAHMPVAMLRGAESDLLSAITMEAFAAALPHAQCMTVPDRGHVPFLDEPQSTSIIASWLAQVDAKEKGRS